MKKNVASQVIGAQMTTAADGSDFTGSVTVYVTGNGGTQAVGSVGSGACVHEGNGFHSYVPAQAETNYDHVAFTFKASGAITSTIQVYPNFPQTGDNFALIGTAGAGLTSLASATNLAVVAGYIDSEVASILAAVDTEVAAIKVKTDFLPSATAGAAGGLFIAGSNAATTVNITGNIIGTVSTVTTLTNLPSITAGWITAAGIAASALNGKGDWLLSSSNGSGLSAIPWNAAWDTEVQSEVQDAIEVNHLDHLLAADYDPASKPGVATALLNELVESDSGVSRYTANALEQAPSGTGASAATIADAVWDEVLSGHLTAGSTGEALDGAGGGGGVADWTANEKTAIRAILGIPAAGTTPDDPTTGILDTIRDAVGVVDDFLDTEMPALTVSAAAIKAKTDNLPSDPADASDVATAIAALSTKIDVVDDLLDTEMPALTTAVAAVKAETASIQADTNDIQARLPAALVGGRMDSNLSAISNSTTTMAAFNRAVKTNVIGTVGAASTTTSVKSSSLTPAGSVADQFKGLILKFADDTTTAALRGQATAITASTASATPTFTCTALTTAPVAGDTFILL